MAALSCKNRLTWHKTSDRTLAKLKVSPTAGSLPYSSFYLRATGMASVKITSSMWQRPITRNLTSRNYTYSGRSRSLLGLNQSVWKAKYSSSPPSKISTQRHPSILPMSSPRTTRANLLPWVWLRLTRVSIGSTYVLENTKSLLWSIQWLRWQTFPRPPPLAFKIRM